MIFCFQGREKNMLYTNQYNNIREIAKFSYKKREAGKNFISITMVAQVNAKYCQTLMKCVRDECWCDTEVSRKYPLESPKMI